MDVIKSLHEAVTDFVVWIEVLPEEAKRNRLVSANAGEPPNWGPKEVLAHLVYYHELYVSELEALLRGEDYDPPAGSREELNKRAVKASRVTPADALAQRLRAANLRLGVLLEESNLDEDLIVYRQGAEPQTLHALAEGEAEHIRHHLVEQQAHSSE